VSADLLLAGRLLIGWIQDGTIWGGPFNLDD
jgi:hypothetical protein